MMKIHDLLRPDPGLRQYASTLVMDPLTETDALQEAQLLDVRFDALAGVAGLLFELRVALQLQEANTGVLIARGVRELAWTGTSRDTSLTAWSIESSLPQTMDQLFRLRLVMWPSPGAHLLLAAENAAFFVGDVPGLSEVPPDYSDLDRGTLGQEVAGWESSFESVRAAFVDPVPKR